MATRFAASNTVVKLPKTQPSLPPGALMRYQKSSAPPRRSRLDERSSSSTTVPMPSFVTSSAVVLGSARTRTPEATVMRDFAMDCADRVAGAPAMNSQAATSAIEIGEELLSRVIDIPARLGGRTRQVNDEKK